MDRTLRSQEDLVLAFIDVDGLKHVNDQDGHTAGDTLLRAVARCVREEFRSYDLVVRYGGDEFVCALTGDGMPSVSERFARVQTRLTSIASGATISVGLSQRHDDDTIELLIDRADAALSRTRRTDS